MEEKKKTEFEEARDRMKEFYETHVYDNPSTEKEALRATRKEVEELDKEN